MRSLSGFPAAAAEARAARAKTDSSRSAYVFDTAVVFPHLAVGPAWETSFIIMNMSETTGAFSLRFYATDGTPMSLSFSSGTAAASASDVVVTGTLVAGGSTTITAYDDGQPLRTGYAILTPPSSTQRFGGFAVFRQKITGQPGFEATVPLCDQDDWTFFMPFDNTTGVFDTGMAIVNPSTTTATSVYLAFIGENGTVISEQTLVLKAGEQQSFSLPVKYPVLANKKGVVYAYGESDYLSALGLRFNQAGGGAFTTVPVLNWSGMY
ncbi:MAG TPA: hypothetical protein PLZ95_13875 [Bryobacteraceae bacterium]|nr:hypothetical protein [Bryobacteraceae bacterium]